MFKNEKSSKSRKKRPWFYSKWYKKSNGRIIMDEAPRTIFGTKRKIKFDYTDNDFKLNQKQ